MPPFILKLQEYVDNTEDYINIVLDDKQNQLLRMGLFISTASFMVTLAVVATGFLSINIHIDLFDETYNQWYAAFGGCSEYVHNTKDYINVVLDDEQNQLLRMGLFISTASFMITLAVVAIGFLSINIHIDLFNGTYNKWYAAFGGCSVLQYSIS
ncbi:hypothetical protein Vadar_031030 [Vaccinium darrowii]|uniref:Uncharacterized protein n=1 Tax=Vaccinium darrowii TaxID=229202 RepID=A0ACB7ZN05_9ERIC|nr:hypothetical protein Vadar_031030 [Vaccinium darrowii]